MKDDIHFLPVNQSNASKSNVLIQNNMAIQTISFSPGNLEEYLNEEALFGFLTFSAGTCGVTVVNLSDVGNW